ncbi:restriction endonuclease subunit M, partial [Escherichia coli]
MHSLMNSQARDTRDRSQNDDNVLEISELNRPG